MNHANQCLPLEYRLHNETDSVLLLSAVIKHLLFLEEALLFTHIDWTPIKRSPQEDVRDILSKKTANIDNCILMAFWIKEFSICVNNLLNYGFLMLKNFGSLGLSKIENM